MKTILTLTLTGAALLAALALALGLATGIVVAQEWTPPDPPDQPQPTLVERVSEEARHDWAITACWDELQSIGDQANLRNYIEACYLGYQLGFDAGRMVSRKVAQEKEARP